MPRRLLFLSEDPEHVDEEIDEVEVEVERTQERYLLGSLAHIGSLQESPLDPLHIPSRQSAEEDHAQATNDEVEHRAAKEHIDQSGNDQADKRHDQETTYRGQVLLGRIANQGHGAKHTCRDKEGQGYGSRSIDGEEDAHRHTIEDGEGDEAHGSRSDRDTAEAGRQPDNQSDLGCKRAWASWNRRDSSGGPDCCRYHRRR